MNKPYLRANTRQEIVDALLAAGLLIQPVSYDELGNPTPSGEPYPAPGVDIDEVGVIPDMTDPENSVPLPGYHFNLVLRGNGIPIELAPVIIPTPATPYRMYP